MTAGEFSAEVVKVLASTGAEAIEAVDAPQPDGDFLVGVSCAFRGERYELSAIAPTEAFRELARKRVLVAAQRFAREHGA